MELAHTIAGPAAADTVVLLHGVGNSRERHTDIPVAWLRSHGHRVVNVDLRGHGESARANSYQLDDYTDDVVDLIEDLGAGGVTIVGHSMGGVVAASVAAARPRLVDGLFLEDPALYRPGPGDPAEVAAAAHAFAGEVRERQRNGVTVGQIVTELKNTPSAYRGRTMGDIAPLHVLEAIARARLALDPKAFEDFYGWETFDDDDRWSKIRCPVTVLRSDPALDAHFLPKDLDRFLASVPQAVIHIAKGAGHSILLQPEGPDFYLTALGEFLGSKP